MSLLIQRTPPRILMYLADQNEPVTINDIAFEIGIAQSHVSILISKFEYEKLISTSTVGREKLVTLTKKGREAASCTKALMSVVAA